MRTSFLLIALLAAVQPVFAQSYRYQTDLASIREDRLEVTLLPPPLGTPEAVFHFPAVIPGTYATADYGRLVSDFRAEDAAGQPLAVVRAGNNSFRISGADRLARIRYRVDDSFDAGLKQDPIFEPAGTNLEAGRNVVMNHAGFFGFFEGLEDLPVELEIRKPASLHGVSALAMLEQSPERQVFRAADYHQLIDCPILFAGADTLSFWVNNTRVELAVYSQTGEPYASRIYRELKASMDAIAAFLPELPVDRYAFLFYIADYREAGRMFTSPDPSLKDLLAFVRQLRGKGFGALEHGNSSVYFLPDFGVGGVEGLSVESMIKDVAIHEFMHIITPLGLHSQHIGDFDFVDPVMSRHLWLYEGITEYFAGLIQVQGGLMTPSRYVSDYMRDKVRAGDAFPEKKMSFAEMSAGVLEKKYHKHYNHVYDRGAVLGLLLDIEIIRLTNGQKTLREVVLALRDRYGAERAFDEAGFIREFVAEVHPDLQRWFDAYIEGRTDWDLAGGLLPLGVSYQASYTARLPRHPVRDNDVRMDMLGLSVSKTGKKEWAGLQPGDRLLQADVDAALRDADGNWLPEGTQSSLRVTRKGKELRLPLEIRYETVKRTDGLEWLGAPSAEQARLRAVWLGKE
ncbi:MAG: hypothetical protein NW241_08335 [Bacteroidia bacterium]|nr:hypothetical protein [Bacteroidia bacterium]